MRTVFKLCALNYLQLNGTVRIVEQAMIPVCMDCMQ
jgi:hypothetical protein